LKRLTPARQGVIASSPSSLAPPLPTAADPSRHVPEGIGTTKSSRAGGLLPLSVPVARSSAASDCSWSGSRAVSRRRRPGHATAGASSGLSSSVSSARPAAKGKVRVLQDVEVSVKRAVWPLGRDRSGTGTRLLTARSISCSPPDRGCADRRGRGLVRFLDLTLTPAPGG
jgi:hypothetical protein